MHDPSLSGSTTTGPIRSLLTTCFTVLIGSQKIRILRAAMSDERSPIHELARRRDVVNAERCAFLFCRPLRLLVCPVVLGQVIFAFQCQSLGDHT